jgi:hypothetical protein
VQWIGNSESSVQSLGSHWQMAMCLHWTDSQWPLMPALLPTLLDLLNNPDKPIKYHKNGTLFFIENCPNFIYKNKEYDIQKILPTCSKILELKGHKNGSKIEGIVMLNQQLAYVSFDTESDKIEKQINLGNYEIKSNVLMDSNAIYYIDGLNRIQEIKID